MKAPLLHRVGDPRLHDEPQPVPGPESGCTVLVGIPPDDRMAFSGSVARRKELTIKLTRWMQHAYPPAIRLTEIGLVDVRSLVTHPFPLTEFVRAFAIAERHEGLEVIIEP